MSHRETNKRKTGTNTVRHSPQAKQKTRIHNSSTQDINHAPVFTKT